MPKGHPDPEPKLARREGKGVRTTAFDMAAIRWARLCWCTEYDPGRDPEEIDALVAEKNRHVGMRAEDVTAWRKERRPDNLSWTEFRQRLALAKTDEQQYLAGAQNEYELRHWILKGARQAMAMAMTWLEPHLLYTKSGEEVTELYTAEGKVVPVTPLRPETCWDAARVAEKMGHLMSEQVRHLAELEELDRKRETEQAELARQLGDAVAKALGAEAWEKVQSVLFAEGGAFREVEDEPEERGRAGARLLLVSGDDETRDKDDDEGDEE